MSLEILPSPEKEINTKTSKTTLEVKTDQGSDKKEAPSLFDSLMKNVKENSATLDDKVEKSDIKNIKKEDVSLDSEKSTKTPVNKMVDNLVDIVVDEVKNKSKNIKDENPIDTKDSIKKESEKAVEDIKTEVSKIKIVDTDTNIEKNEKVNVKNETVKTEVEVKTTAIKEAVEDIKTEVSKIKIVDTDTNIEKKEKNDIKTEVEVKTTAIKEAVEDIKTEVSKIKIVDTDANIEKKDIKLEVEPKLTDINKSGLQDLTLDGEIEIVKDIKKDTKIIDESKLNSDKSVLNSKENIDSKIPLMANMFLNSQKKTKETVSLEQISNAKKNIDDAKTVDSVKTSAKMLDLNPDEIDIESSKEKNVQKQNILDIKEKKENVLNITQNNSLNRIIIDKKTQTNHVDEIITTIKDKVIETEQIKVKEKEIAVSLNVPQNIVETIQSKIIGAQQKVGNFMSDVARSMYLNYKPPVTAFRMNLNPANLGSISIIMKANKVDNSISVSMNMSSSSTMETFAENKASLQNALQRQLGENSDVTLKFDMQNNSSDGESSQSNQNDSNTRNNSNTEVEERNIDNPELEIAENTDYM